MSNCKYEKINKCIGDTAHYINNPLQVIMGTVLNLKMSPDVSKEELSEEMDTLLREVNNIKKAIVDMVEFKESFDNKKEEETK